MRILFIANCVSLYGANRSMLDLALGLEKLGQEIYFIIPWEGTGRDRFRIRKRLESHKYSYKFMRYSPSVHLSNDNRVKASIFHREINKNCLPLMKQYAEEAQIDIIHTNSFTHTIGSLLSRQINKPHVWHIREVMKKDYDLAFDSQFLYQYSLRNTEQIICISEYVKKEHRKILRSVPVAVMQDGLDVSQYIIDNSYREHLDICNILICGVIQEGKGQLDAVKAVEGLIHKYHLKNIHLKIVGDGFGRYLEKIKKFIKDYELEDYIDILPFQEDLRELRRNTDIALVCSRSEALGRVTIEGMLSENLVIGADSGATKEIIKDGETGYLYEEGNIKELCQKIYFAVKHWKGQELLIRKAKEYACHNYDINNYAEKILRIYEKFC